MSPVPAPDPLDIRVVVIEDTPAMLKRQIDCVSGAVDLVSDCRRNREPALEERGKILRDAAAAVSGVAYLDFTDLLCSDKSCPAVMGHVVVYRDTSSHLTATFARTFAPLARQQLTEVVAG